LKEKRANGGELEQPKEEAVDEKSTTSSKFRPIGFKPIGSSAEETGKKKKRKEGSEPKKKKRKVEPSTMDPGEQVGKVTPAPPLVEHAASTSALPETIQAETVEEDFDIFADAGEYQGVEFGSDDDDNDSETGHDRPSHPAPIAESMSVPPSRGWFDDAAEPEPEAQPPQTPAEQPTPVPEAKVDGDEEQPARLAPLTSSAMPSIRDFLAMDQVVEKEEKRKARKEKRKGKNKDS
jgi:hypothetical protein